MKKLLLMVFLSFFLISCPQPTDDGVLSPDDTDSPDGTESPEEPDSPDEPDLPSVVIDGLTATGGDTSITLSWTTDVAADCTVYYGPYSFYGLSAPASSADKLTHSVEFTDLRPHTNYHFKISATPESAEYGVTATEDHEEHTDLDYPGATIVTGEEWDAVGALCFADADGFYGPFCTGVLIADDVVLTAAHCLSVNEDYYGAEPSTSNVVFYVGGNDATPTAAGGEPEAGTVYEVDAIVVHSSYDAGAEFPTNDLALVHLTESVSEAITTPVAINTNSLSDLAGSDFTIVGFDASYLGTKKEKGQKLSEIDSDSFTDDNDDGTNLGSAGIPAFMTISGELKVIGISASVAGEPFTGPATYTQVYSDSTWINGKISDFSSP